MYDDVNRINMAKDTVWWRAAVNTVTSLNYLNYNQLLKQGCTYPERLNFVHTNGPSQRKPLDVTIPAYRIWRWLVEFWKICEPLFLRRTLPCGLLGVITHARTQRLSASLQLRSTKRIRHTHAFTVWLCIRVRSLLKLSPCTPLNKITVSRLIQSSFLPQRYQTKVIITTVFTEWTIVCII